MKAIFEISLGSIKSNRKNSLIVLIGIVLSVALIVTVLAFSLTLVDFMEFGLFMNRYANSTKPPEELLARVYTDAYYIAFAGISIMFSVAAVFAAILSISSALSITYGEKAKTLAVISTMGADTKHQFALLAFDVLILSVVGIPLGMIIGISVSYNLVEYLNEFVIIPSIEEMGLSFEGILNGRFEDNIRFLQGNSVFWCSMAGLTSVFSVITAAFKPVLRQFRNSSIEIAKSYNAINVSLKESLLDKLVYKIWGFDGELASANYQNNKIRYRQFSLSVAMSATLFIMISLFLTYFSSILIEYHPLLEYFEMFFYFFILAVFVITLFASSCTLYANFMKRKNEFAMLLSMGIDDSKLYRVICIEAVYYGLYMLGFVFVSSIISDLVIFNIMSPMKRDMNFIYPWTEMAVAVGVIVAITFCLSLFMTSVVKKVEIVPELKKNF